MRQFSQAVTIFAIRSSDILPVQREIHSTTYFVPKIAVLVIPLSLIADMRGTGNKHPALDACNMILSGCAKARYPVGLTQANEVINVSIEWLPAKTAVGG